jgi:hypothetical protein
MSGFAIAQRVEVQRRFLHTGKISVCWEFLISAELS